VLQDAFDPFLLILGDVGSNATEALLDSCKGNGRVVDCLGKYSPLFGRVTEIVEEPEEGEDGMNEGDDVEAHLGYLVVAVPGCSQAKASEKS
jgi:hypothetical protein